jgi:hypothetical protein
MPGVKTEKQERLAAGNARHMECSINAPVYLELGGTDESRRILPTGLLPKARTSSLEDIRGLLSIEAVLTISEAKL